MTLGRAKQRFSIVLLIASVTFSLGNAQAVVIENKEWRQLSETVGFSYDELDTIFNTASGIIDSPSTSLVSSFTGLEVDFFGWTWASVSDVKGKYSDPY